MVSAPVDPEFDDRPPVAPGDCPGGRCDGSGWIRVGHAYVDRWAPLPTLTVDDLTDQYGDEVGSQLYEVEMRLWSMRRAALLNSSYPCPHCQPGPFARWAGGHWDSHHNREACDECRTVDASTGKRYPKRRTPEVHREADTPPDPPPAPDLPTRLDLA